MKTAQSVVFKKPQKNAKNRQKPRFSFRRQPRNFENVTLVARRRKHFLVFLAIFLVAQLPPTTVFFITQEFTRFLSTVSSERRATRSDVSF